MTYRKIILILIATFAMVSGSRGLLLINQRALSPAQSALSTNLENTGSGPGMKTTDEMIEFWQGRFERNPRDFISVTFLADAYIRKARETGDVNEYERADAALQKALSIHPNYDVAQAYLSTVRYVQHDFQGALNLASQVYTAHPNAIGALATMGDANLELGNYGEAEFAYKKLAEKSQSAAIYMRLARLAWLHGKPGEALTWMEQATIDSDKTGLLDENSAWYHFQLGELNFNTNHLPLAEEQYSIALKSFDRYYLALAGMGKVRAAEGRYSEAIEYYEEAVAIIPQPDLLSALGDLYIATGSPDKAKYEYDTVEFIGKLQAINKVIYNRQLALFYANHDRNLEESLQLAQNELAHRKDIYAYDTYAWALYKNGHYAKAADVMQQSLKLGTQDAMLYYHAGMIYKSLGDNVQAQTMLSKALSINPHFDLVQACIAKSTLLQLQIK